jgi:hypothetical protein
MARHHRTGTGSHEEQFELCVYSYLQCKVTGSAHIPADIASVSKGVMPLVTVIKIKKQIKG